MPLHASDLLTGGNHVREEGCNDVWDGFVEDLDTTSLSTWCKFSGRNLTATMDIPSTQNWKAMKTMSRKGSNIGAADQTDSILHTFSLGVVQPIVTVRKVLNYLSYLNPLCRGPVEGNQAFAVKHHVGIGVT